MLIIGKYILLNNKVYDMQSKHLEAIEPYEVPWRNAWATDRYNQMCRPDELKSLNPKLFFLIDKYGEAFDSYFWYYYNRKKTYIKRVPLWLNQKKVDCEKPKEYEPNRKLTEYAFLS